MQVKSLDRQLSDTERRLQEMVTASQRQSSLAQNEVNFRLYHVLATRQLTFLDCELITEQINQPTVQFGEPVEHFSASYKVTVETVIKEPVAYKTEPIKNQLCPHPHSRKRLHACRLTNCSSS